MKLLIFITIIILSFNLFGQESFSFSIPQPANESNVISVDPIYFGSYTSTNIDTYYEFNSQGIWAISTIYSSILRETIRESSKYSVRNGYLFGVVENDSVPCFLEDERYHFGVKHREQIIGLHSKHVLKKINTTNYIINFYENDSYTPSLFVFKGKNLEVKHFDYEINTTLFSNIKIQNANKTSSMNYIVLTPTSKEWSKIEKAGIFGKGLLFLRK